MFYTIFLLWYGKMLLENFMVYVWVNSEFKGNYFKKSNL